VRNFKGGYRSNVFGVFMQTENKDTKAHNRMSRRTQSYNNKYLNS
jgi:hypothetical protein